MQLRHLSSALRLTIIIQFAVFLKIQSQFYLQFPIFPLWLPVSRTKIFFRDCRLPRPESLHLIKSFGESRVSKREGPQLATTVDV